MIGSDELAASTRRVSSASCLIDTRFFLSIGSSSSIRLTVPWGSSR